MKRTKLYLLIFVYVLSAIGLFRFEANGSAFAAEQAASGVVYEAEDAASDGIAVDDGYFGKRFSGQAYLLSEPNRYVRFTVRTDTAGFYRLELAICGYFIGNVVFDESDSTKIYIGYDDTTLHTLFERIYFGAGEHTVRLTISNGGPCGIDFLSVASVETFDLDTYPFETDYPLSNPNATAQTRRLFSFIQANYGKNIISGQNSVTGYRDADFQRIREKTGKLPAMIGLDLQEYSPALGMYRTDTAIGYAQEYAALGGIVTLHWHWIAPTELLLQTEDGYPKHLWQGFRTGAVDVDKIVTAMTDKTSAGYRALLEDMDAIAAQLKRLADADVPVLFRPLHEASGGWFWWSLGGKQAYIDLWKTMYTKFTQEHRLNNLIWVWNGQNKDWYPGDAYVDIVGEDIYVDARNYTDHNVKFAEVVRYADTPKVAALSECGVLFDVDRALARKSMWSWFLNWTWIHTIPKDENQVYATDADGNILYNTSVSPQQPYPVQTELAAWIKVYNHPNVLTLDDLPFHTHIDNDADTVCDICNGRASQIPADPTTPTDNTGVWIAAVTVLSILLCAAITVAVLFALKPKKQK